MRSAFLRNKNWFFGAQITASLLDIPETLFKSYDGLRGVPREYYGFIAALILIDAVGLGSSNRKIHKALPILWLALIVGYETATSIHRIVGG